MCVLGASDKGKVGGMSRLSYLLLDALLYSLQLVKHLTPSLLVRGLLTAYTIELSTKSITSVNSIPSARLADETNLVLDGALKRSVE